MARRILLAMCVLLACVMASGLIPGSARAAGSLPHCTVESGQALIDSGAYARAEREFSCVIAAQPSDVDGYRGRIEARLMLRRFSDAFADYAQVTAKVLPTHPDAASAILAGYGQRLAVDPTELPALTGLSFAHWWLFAYAAAINVLKDLLAVAPNDVYGALFLGSSSMLKGGNQAQAAAQLDAAISLAPGLPDVHYIVADAFLYGAGDCGRAYPEAGLAFDGGLDTPRVNAILGSCELSNGDVAAAAAHLARHIELVTTEYVLSPPLAAGASLNVDLVPGRTFDIPVAVVAGEMLSIQTRSNDYFDSIAVLLAPDGTPVTGGDDFMQYFAGFSWVAEQTGTYHLLTTFFESVNTGTLKVTRK